MKLQKDKHVDYKDQLEWEVRKVRLQSLWVEFTPKNSNVSKMLKRGRKFHIFVFKDALVSFKPNVPKESFKEKSPQDIFFLYEWMTDDEWVY